MKKICSKCGTEKDATEFYKERRHSDGLQNWCKSCRAEYNRKYYGANSEKMRERNHKWKKANPEKVRAKDREWKKANPEKVREGVRKWRENNLEKVRAMYRASFAEARSELADSYVNQKLKRQFGIPIEEIDSDMVEAKRRELKYRRIYNQLTKDSK